MFIPLIFFLKRLFFSPRQLKDGGIIPYKSRHLATSSGPDAKELVIYKKFLKELNKEERDYFSTLFRECVYERNYPRTEDLFQYCYLSTLKFRMEKIWRGNTHSSLCIYIYAQGIKELEYTIFYHRENLEKGGRVINLVSSPSSFLEERTRQLSSPLRSLDKGAQKSHIMSLNPRARSSVG